MQAYFAYFTRGVLTSAAVFIVVAGLLFYWYSSTRALSYITATVMRGAITQEVSASGNVAAPSTINLQFGSSGKLALVSVKIGDKVKAGKVLARQDTSVLRAQLSQARAAVDAQKAQLQSLELGTRPEQLAVTQSQVTSDKAALAQANQNVINAIQNAYTASDDAVHNKVDLFVNNPRTTSPSLMFNTSASQVGNNILTERVSVESMLTAWQGSISILTPASDLSAAQTLAQANLALVTQLLADSNTALNNAVSSGSITSTSVSGWVASVAAGRTSVNAALSGLSAAVVAQQAASAALDRDQKNLALQQAGSTASTVAGQQAVVAQAQAQVAAIEAQISLLSLVAPVSGTITEVNGDVGETISPSVVVISLLPDTKLQADVNLSEDNVANVKVGDSVSLTLDAFLGTTWHGVVSHVDPAQTIIGGAVYYKATVLFVEPDDRIKPGMTANVLIETGSSTNALIVPASAIQTEGINSFVQVLNGRTATKQPVAIGLKSQNGMVEVTSGLTAGQLVVTGSL